MEYMITKDSGEQVLVHHGVKGMKWGVRKANYESMTGKEKRRTKKEYKTKIAKSGGVRRVKRKDMTPAQRAQSNRQILASIIAGPIGSTIAAKTGVTKDETTRNGRNFIMASLLGPFGASTIYVK